MAEELRQITKDGQLIFTYTPGASGAPGWIDGGRVILANVSVATHWKVEKRAIYQISTVINNDSVNFSAVTFDGKYLYLVREGFVAETPPDIIKTTLSGEIVWATSAGKSITGITNDGKRLFMLSTDSGGQLLYYRKAKTLEQMRVVSISTTSLKDLCWDRKWDQHRQMLGYGRYLWLLRSNGFVKQILPTGETIQEWAIPGGAPSGTWRGIACDGKYLYVGQSSIVPIGDPE